MAHSLHHVLFSMRPFLPALLFLVTACSSPAPVSQLSAAAESGGDAVKTLVVHDVEVELGAKRSTVTLPLGDAAPAALAVARDEGRPLVLRVEGISVTQQPGVTYDVHLDGAPGEVGVLSFYGAEESNGNFMAAFPIDEAAARVLRDDSRELRVTFTPRGITDEQGREVITLTGTARFTRLRLVEE
jgi:hypothetical protein